MAEARENPENGLVPDQAAAAPETQDARGAGADRVGGGGASGSWETASDDVGALILAARRQRDEADAVDFLEGFADLPDEPEAGREPDGRNLATRVVSDVAGGLGEAPRQVAGGALDAVRGALSGVAAFDQWASERLNLPKLQVFDREGNLDIEVLSAQEAGQADVMLPEVDAPDTVTGGLVRGVSQFLTGFAGGARAIGGLKGATAAGSAARASGAAAISDFAAFDGHEERLSDLVQSVPALQNPVTEYLSSDMEDNELEGRLKNVTEGVLTDVALSGVVGAISQVRRARRIKGDRETYAELAREMAEGPKARDWMPEGQTSRFDDLPLVAHDLADIPDETAARALTEGKVPVGEREVYVNWNRIDGPEDLKEVIQQMADTARGEIDEARRGVRSNEQTRLSADQINAWEVLAERRAGTPLNAEESLALRDLWATSGQRLLDAARAVRQAPTPENHFLFRRAVALHGSIQREAMAVRTETARALQQWSIPAGESEAMARQMGDVIGQFGNRNVSDSMADTILEFAQRGEFDRIDSFTRKGAFAASMDAVVEYRTAALLTNPVTHMVNILSNASVAGLGIGERLGAAGIGALRGGADAVPMQEVSAMIYGLGSSLGDAWRFARESWRTGKTGFYDGAPGFAGQKVEFGHTRAVSSEALGSTRNTTFNKVMNTPLVASGVDVLGEVMGGAFRALGAADEFFKTINHRAQLHALSARRATAEMRAGQIAPDGLARRIAELVEDPPEHVLMEAREFARVQTFTEDPGDLIQAFTQARNERAFGVGKLFVPFVNTPANIFRYTFERSPAAPMVKRFRDDFMAGGARRDLALSKMALGSAVMWTGFSYMLDGRITGAGPTNPSERAALYRTGWRPYSVKIGDTFFAYSRMDPFGMQLGIAANLAELAMQGQDDKPLDAEIYGMIGAAGETLLDKSYLQGVGDLFAALAEPDRRARHFMQRLAGSFVPAGLRWIEGIADPEVRRPSNTIEEVQSRVPRPDPSVPVRHDLWGRPIRYRSNMGVVYDALSPFYAAEHKPEPIDAEFLRIGVTPGSPTNTLTIDRERFSLRERPDIYEEYVVLQGGTPASSLMPKREDLTASQRRLKSYGDATLLDTLNAVVTGAHPFSAEYADGDENEKKNLIYRVIGDYRRAAKDRLIERHSDYFVPGSGM